MCERLQIKGAYAFKLGDGVRYDLQDVRYTHLRGKHVVIACRPDTPEKQARADLMVRSEIVDCNLRLKREELRVVLGLPGENACNERQFVGLGAVAVGGMLFRVLSGQFFLLCHLAVLTAILRDGENARHTEKKAAQANKIVKKMEREIALLAPLCDRFFRKILDSDGVEKELKSYSPYIIVSPSLRSATRPSRFGVVLVISTPPYHFNAIFVVLGKLC